MSPLISQDINIVNVMPMHFILGLLKTNDFYSIHNTQMSLRMKIIRFYQMSLVVREPAFCIYENKDADQLAVTVKLISVFVFAI